MIVEIHAHFFSSSMNDLQERIDFINNSGKYIEHVIEKIASIKNLSYQEVCDITTSNALKLFEKIGL